MLKKILNILGFQKDEVESSLASGEVPTIPITDEKISAGIQPLAIAKRPNLPQLIAGCAQSVGMMRGHNEDAILVYSALFANQEGYVPVGLFIVADGMGGHKHGEVASNLAVRVVGREVIQKIMLGFMDIHPTPPEEGIQEILESSVMAAHRTITKESPGSGTTLTAILILDKHMSIAHVGDSRAYSLDNQGKLEILTRDHSLVKRMMELGHLTEQEAAIHPQRNVLYRALGQGEPFTPDISTTALPNAGHLLICSDGLWGVVPQDEMVRLIRSTSSPDLACQLLIDAANKAGGPDNISAILVQLPIFSD
ncbi:MAG: hypothetical protein B6D39_11840 [Anaerolineae bacterium UTCFX2]|nr:protein phosphatase 2C domain-containing protein [Anaerolineales bacterium]OQY88108.1 MAG: hypothetical protein B6D39_11840 [Anaerolineae bacterium UTCFX2]